MAWLVDSTVSRVLKILLLACFLLVLLLRFCLVFSSYSLAFLSLSSYCFFLIWSESSYWTSGNCSYLCLVSRIIWDFDISGLSPLMRRSMMLIAELEYLTPELSWGVSLNATEGDSLDFFREWAGVLAFLLWRCFFGWSKFAFAFLILTWGVFS